MQLELSAEQKLPGQACEQQTLPPDTVPTQAPEAHSAACAQVWPALSRQTPSTSWLPAGHTQLPSAAHARPDAAQPPSQQRCVPVTSRTQLPDWHSVLARRPSPSPSAPRSAPWLGRSRCHTPCW